MTDSSDSDSVSARVAFLRGLRAVRQLRPDPLPESLAAAAQGVGADVGHFTGPGDTWAASAEAKPMLGIPEQFVLRETISLGYPAEHLQRTPNPPGRKPLEQLVHREHY